MKINESLLRKIGFIKGDTRKRHGRFCNCTLCNGESLMYHLPNIVFETVQRPYMFHISKRKGSPWEIGNKSPFLESVIVKNMDDIVKYIINHFYTEGFNNGKTNITESVKEILNIKNNKDNS